MKNLSFAVLMSFLSLAVVGPVPASADPMIPAEVSAVLLSPEYAAAVAAEVRKANAAGLELRINDFSIVRLDGPVYVYLNLSRRPRASLDGWTAYGELVAGIQYGPMGEIRIDSLYFTPAAEVPGGASVGNM